MGDLLSPERFREKLERVISEKDAVCRATYGVPLDTEGLADQYLALGERLKPLIADASLLINDALDAGLSVLFEGAQGTMLDIDFGTYPYVTSSNAISGGACTGLGVGPTRINAVAGVTKAYTTRVGSGPFPTEMPDLEAKEVRDRGKEYGAVTGRPRRCGWLDLVVLKYAVRINGISTLVVTKLDVFDTQKEIQVCTGYRYKGTPIREMPECGRGTGRSDARIPDTAGLAVGHLRRAGCREAAACGAGLSEIHLRFYRRRNRHDFHRPRTRRDHRMRRDAARFLGLSYEHTAALH